MTEYRVRWEIDIDAENPQQAARRALEIQRNRGSIATVFDIAEHPQGPYQRIDLGQPPAASGEEEVSSSTDELDPDEEPTRVRWALYDFDTSEMLRPTYDSYQAAVDDLDPRLTNVIVISFPV